MPKPPTYAWRKHAVLLALSIVGAADVADLRLLAADTPSPKTIRVSDPLPAVPARVGFIDATGLSEKIRMQALAGEPASKKVLGGYYTTNALAEILNQGYITAPSPFCKAVLEKEYASGAS